MTGLLGPDHEHLGAILDLIGDEEELWSPHGIRSLSKQDEYYGTAENYWRSPVWMPLNYLIVKNLLVSLGHDHFKEHYANKITTGHRPTARSPTEARSDHVH
jgi:mannosyl-oligosaccharide glucosidase